MRRETSHGTTTVWASERDTAAWARHWPGSHLRGMRVRASFMAGDLVDLVVTSESTGRPVSLGRFDSPDELNAFLQDMQHGTGQSRRRGASGGGIRIFEARRKALKVETERRRRDALRQKRSSTTGRFTH